MSGQSSSSFFPNRTRFSNEDFDNAIRQLRTTGTRILSLVETGNTMQAEQEMNTYKATSNSVVQMLEARVQEAAALVQGSSSIGYPSDNTSSRMNDGAPTSATYAAHSPTFNTTYGAPSQPVSGPPRPIRRNNRQPEVTGADERSGGTNVVGHVGSAVGSIEARKVDPFLVTLHWRSQEGISHNTVIRAVNVIGDPMEYTWPNPLELEISPCSSKIYDFQAWMQRNKNGTGKMSTAQFQPDPSRTDTQEFKQLVKLLRDGQGGGACYAAASWVIRGKHDPTPNLVLRPCEDRDRPGLFVAIFPVSGAPTEDLQPTHGRSQGSQPPTSNSRGITTMPLAVAASSSGRRAGHSEQAPHPPLYEDQANMSGYPVQPISPQVAYQQQHQAYPYGQQPHPQVWQPSPQIQTQRSRQGQHMESGNTGGRDPNAFHQPYWR